MSTEVLRGKLIDDRLEDVEVIFVANGKTSGGRHFGGRLLFDNEGKLFITLGDRGQRDPSQDLNTHTGSLIRINADGSVPEDNPFINVEGAQPEIYSYGHRNIQGIDLKPGTNIVWTHEHGPQGGDEINIIAPGDNYGWPVITYGVNYVIGTKIGVVTHKEGMEQP
ncbi:MAG: PQQ-dependent sugar dehydrogenase, partial [Pseudomonadota bacterium]